MMTEARLYALAMFGGVGDTRYSVTGPDADGNYIAQVIDPRSKRPPRWRYTKKQLQGQFAECLPDGTVPDWRIPVPDDRWFHCGRRNPMATIIGKSWYVEIDLAGVNAHVSHSGWTVRISASSANRLEGIEIDFKRPWRSRITMHIPDWNAASRVANEAQK